MSHRVSLFCFMAGCVSLTFLVSVIFLPLISSFHVTNQTTTNSTATLRPAIEMAKEVNINSTSKHNLFKQMYNAHNRTTSAEASSNYQTIFSPTLNNNLTRPNHDVTKLNNGKTSDLIRDESIVHTITVNSSSLLGEEEPLLSSFGLDAAIRTRRELIDSEKGEVSVDKSKKFDTSVNSGSTGESVQHKQDKLKFISNYTISSHTNHNKINKTQPIKIRTDQQAHGGKDSRISSRSLKFLKRIKSKRKLKEQQQKAKNEEPANYTSAASYNYKNWIDFNGSPINSLAKRKKNKLNRLFQMKNQDHEMSSDATSIKEPKAAQQDETVGVNQSDESLASQNQPGDEQSSPQVNSNEEGSAGGGDQASQKQQIEPKIESSPPQAPRQQQQQQQAQLQPQLHQNDQQSLIDGFNGFQVKKEHSSTKEENSRPLINKSVATTTTIDDGNKRAKLTSKSASLPPGLRQRIIDQFVKSGGDPQNIVVSDSTITTTSQSKKKTITTTYRIVPNSNLKLPLKQRNLKPITMIKEKISEENIPDDKFDFVGGNFNSYPPTSNLTSLLGNPKKVDKTSQENLFKNLIKDDKKPGKLKKIMVKRVEVPQSIFMVNSNKDVNKGDNNGDLGEFYQGPHEAMFGINDKSNEFSTAQKKAILNLDKIMHNSFSSNDEHDKVKHLMDMKMNKNEMINGGSGFKMDQSPKGVSGGGISLDALMGVLNKPAAAGKDKDKTTTSMPFESPSISNQGREEKHHDLGDQIKDKQFFDSNGSGDNFGKNYQQPQQEKSQQQSSNKHLSNFHKVTNKSAPAKKASESTYTNHGANEQPEDKRTNNSTDGVSNGKKSPIKALKVNDRNFKSNQENVEHNLSIKTTQETDKVIRSDKKSEQRDKSNFFADLKSQKLDSLEELKRVVLAVSSKRLKESKSVDKKKQQVGGLTKSASEESVGAKNGALRRGKNHDEAKKMKSLDENSSDDNKSDGKSLNSSQQQQVAQQTTIVNASSTPTAIKTKTHNIMMLIDFGPQQQQQSLVDDTSQYSQLNNKQESHHNHHQFRLDKSATNNGNFVRPFLSPQPSNQLDSYGNRWTPVGSKGTTNENGASLVPTVNVQIYNNHLEQQQRDQKALSDYDLPDQDESINSMRQSNANYHHHHHLTSIGASNDDIESEFEGPMFDAASSSAIKPLIYQTPLPSFGANSFNGFNAHSSSKVISSNGLAGSSNYLKIGQHQQVPALMFGALAPPRPPQVVNSNQAAATPTEAPILPEESASTNQLVKQVIDELAMAATNEQHNIGDNNAGEHLYTTTSVRDSTKTLRGNNPNSNGGSGIDDEDDDDDDVDDDVDHLLAQDRLSQLNSNGQTAALTATTTRQQLNSRSSHVASPPPSSLSSLSLQFKRRSEDGKPQI